MFELRHFIILRINFDWASEFASMCGDEIKALLQRSGFHVIDLFGEEVKLQNLIKVIMELQNQEVAVAYYGHGSKPEGFWLDMQRVPFLDCNSVQCLKGCMVYAACCNTLKMGERTVKEKQIEMVIGYSAGFDLMKKNLVYEPFFKRCLNSGLEGLLLAKDISLENLFRYMTNTFEECVDSILNASEDEEAIFAALLLNQNKKRLGYLGDGNKIITLR